MTAEFQVLKRHRQAYKYVRMCVYVTTETPTKGQNLDACQRDTHSSARPIETSSHRGH